MRKVMGKWRSNPWFKDNNPKTTTPNHMNWEKCHLNYSSLVFLFFVIYYFIDTWYTSLCAKSISYIVTKKKKSIFDITM